MNYKAYSKIFPITEAYPLLNKRISARKTVARATLMSDTRPEWLFPIGAHPGQW